jgi:Leucine-rich repeat (LRR) protein
MHDLVHDLARSVIGDELLALDDATKRNTIEHKYCRYAVLKNNEEPVKLSNILPSKVRSVHFSNGSKLDLPGGAFSFAKCLRILDFNECSSLLLPDSLGPLKQLRCLIAPRMKNKGLPECITELPKLQYLNMRESTQISALPESIGKLGCLLYLDLSGCSGISKLPESVGDLKTLAHLDISGCSEIRELPESFGNLTNLQHLELSECYGVRALPESLCGLTQLQYLNLSFCHRLVQLPEAIGSLVNLQYLSLSRCSGIRELPESINKLQNLLHLDLQNCIGIGEKWKQGGLSALTALQHLDMSYFHSNYPYTHVDFISSLTNLEHLSLSDNMMLEYLPEGIGNLKRLHTLNLSGCENLKCLPESIGEINRLKSLLVEGCSDEVINQVYSRLHYSLTLPLFKVGADDVKGCSNLHLLEGVNVGELRIRCLENTKSVDEARKVKLCDKQNLSELTLSWTLGADRIQEDKDVLEQLVPPKGLENLILEGYSSTVFPCWLMDISHHLPNLVFISLTDLPKCISLPPLGQLSNLKHLHLSKLPSITKIDKDFCGGKGAFCQLSRFSLYEMEGLEEWSTTYSTDEDGVEEFMFPTLDNLNIFYCPRLRLKPCPPTFRECEIDHSDQVISSLGEVVAAVGRLSSSPRSTELRVRYSKCQSMEMLRHFPGLQVFELFECDGLTSLPESLRHLSSLQSLSLAHCDNLSVLPEWLSDLSSLRSLEIYACPVKSLPACIQQLTNLKKLDIWFNSELIEWCQSEDNKKKLAHIKFIVSSLATKLHLLS